MNKTSIPFFIATLLISITIQAQNSPQTNPLTPSDRAITTSVPFLMISGDARASGMGDQGVATRADAFSQQWNPAKYAFITDEQGVAISYTPYLRELVTDINLGSLVYYNRISERSAFAGSLRFFSLGTINLRQSIGQEPRPVEPTQLAVDLSYALRLGEEFSMAVTGRYIRSDLKIPGVSGDASAANTFAVDVSAFYQSEEIYYDEFNGRWRAGINISNIGPKIKYDDVGEGQFIPTNFKAGVGFDFILDDNNTIGVYTEFNKLLVPTPQDFDSDGDIDSEDSQEYYDISSIGSIFTSWGDAPGGLSEEMKEITWAVGTEYWYKDSFALRLGYFHESEAKGFRQFLSMGAGFRYSSIDIDVSYLFSTSKVQNPLEGTLRFSLTFNFGKEYDNY